MSKISQFRFPVDIRFGAGGRSVLAEFAEKYNVTNPLLVTDTGLVKTEAFLLISEQMHVVWPKGYVEFSDVHSNPTDEDVDNAYISYAEGGCNGVIGVGGGSAIDAARAMLLKIAFPDLPLIGMPFDDLPEQLTPFCAVPTTAGTGSEVGRSSVITIKARGRKTIFGGTALMAKMAILDPELTVGLPANLTAWTGMDALVHAIEAFVCPAFHPMCDAIALEAIRMVHLYLRQAYDNGSNIEARGMMQMAAAMGATAFQKDLGAVHSMAHPLSTVCNIQHGLANAICLIPVIKFNKEVCAARYARIAQCFDINTFGISDSEATDKVIQAIVELNCYLRIPGSLSEAGAKKEQLQQLAQDAFDDPCHPSNPRPCSKQDFLMLYGEVF